MTVISAVIMAASFEMCPPQQPTPAIVGQAVTGLIVSAFGRTMSSMKSVLADESRIALDLDKLRELRQQRGLSMEQAAKLARMPNRQRWWDIESGRKANITLATLDAICRALKCKPQDLLK
ncbi:helix-turn-helix domain-containing protein [Fontivita pretiosa]|uniref:helix-turn-helix domain-containing protein n=1 Tax=Fontivita pretiosa TaxID=2989684 RepID=UPI003D167120